MTDIHTSCVKNVTSSQISIAILQQRAAEAPCCGASCLSTSRVLLLLWRLDYLPPSRLFIGTCGFGVQQLGRLWGTATGTALNLHLTIEYGIALVIYSVFVRLYLGFELLLVDASARQRPQFCHNTETIVARCHPVAFCVSTDCCNSACCENQS